MAFLFFETTKVLADEDGFDTEYAGIECWVRGVLYHTVNKQKISSQLESQRSCSANRRGGETYKMEVENRYWGMNEAPGLSLQLGALQRGRV